MMNTWRLGLILVAAAMLSACGGGGSSASSGTSGTALAGQFTLTVNTTGLASGESYEIQDSAQTLNVSQSMTVSQNGADTFSTLLYTTDNLQAVKVTVTISQQPSDGAQCVIQPTSNGPYAGDGPPVTNNSDLNVNCGKYPAVKPVAYAQIGTFPGASSAQVIASPKVVPVFFTGSTNVSTYETFLDQLVVSNYWAALSEYGVGKGTVESAINAATTWPATVDDAQVQNLITTNAAWGAPVDSSTVLVIFLPAGTSYMPNSGNGESSSCISTGTAPMNAECAEHDQVTVNGVPVQYVVVPPDSENGGAPGQFAVVAQYLVGAVTNPGGGGPNIGSGAGYTEFSPNPDWYIGRDDEEAVEIGHACPAFAPPESDITLPSGFPGLYMLWSNTAAASDTTYTYCGRKPYGVVADWANASAAQEVTATRFGHTFTDEALVIPPGGSASITLTAWMLSSSSGGNSEPYFDFEGNVNSEWLYLHGTAAPEDCLPGDATGDCVDAPSFMITPVVSANDQSTSSCNQGCDFPETANGDTFKLTVTMPATGTPGIWVAYFGDQPIAVTNANTWN